MKIENKLHNIEININEARIAGVALSMRPDSDVPHIAVSLELISVGGNKIADVTLSTNAWNDNNKLTDADLPPIIYEYAGQIVKALAPVCTRKINSIEKLLK